MEPEIGSDDPLGATWSGSGTNFSVFSEVAERVELCLFDADGNETRCDLRERTAFCWHGYLPGVGPGQRYGFRVHGAYAPEAGLRCDPAKLLVDSYAKEIDGELRWSQEVFSYPFGEPDGPRNELDSAPFVPRSIVVDSAFDWGSDRRPGIPAGETVIYETHVKGVTARHPAVPPELRGTYLGLAHPAVLAHWKRLGVTTLELLPVHAFMDDAALRDRGLHNYWGYNTLGFFAPHRGYAAPGGPGPLREFKKMVKALHAEGFEVILDVVYNHTVEGNHLGPTLCFRGLDNAAYYRLQPDAPKFYADTTGTGNTLNARHPQTLQLILDSLRYWVTEMHVDGFRFDLAVALARNPVEYDRQSPFLDLVQQDPVLRQVKLIAEAWDLGDGGYQVGNFPPRWSEWNGRYRDTVRDAWRGEGATLGEFVTRFMGSPDLYRTSGRGPLASINFVTAHDGFTLHDLVAYNDKHNLANGEENRDGENVNRSWNCGREGPTDDPEIRAFRARQQRNFLFTLLFAQGTPMLLGGDELGRTQQGNNNGYCQDSEISYFDWEHVDEELLAWTTQLIALRREHSVLRHRSWFLGRPLQGILELGWFGSDGAALPETAWGEKPGAFVVLLAAAAAGSDSGSDSPDRLVLVFNLGAEPVEFRLPAAITESQWQLVIDTASRGPGPLTLAEGKTFTAPPRSAQLLRPQR